jgi:hypothetical protein
VIPAGGHPIYYVEEMLGISRNILNNLTAWYFGTRSCSSRFGRWQSAVGLIQSRKCPCKLISP